MKTIKNDTTNWGTEAGNINANFAEATKGIRGSIPFEKLKGNEAERIFDYIQEYAWDGQTNTGDNPIRESIVLPDDFPSIFKKAIRLSFPATLTAPSHLAFQVRTKYVPKIVVSCWTELTDISSGVQNSIAVNYIRGVNDIAVASFGTQFFGFNYAEIKTAINTVGYWEKVYTGYIVRSYGYIEYGGRYYIHQAITATTPVEECDYINIHFGNTASQPTGTLAYSRTYFGFQVGETLLNQFIGFPDLKSIGEQAIIDYNANANTDSYIYTNKIVDFFNGGGRCLMDDGVSVPYNDIGSFTIFTNFAIAAKIPNSKYHEGYTFKYNNGDAFPKYVTNLNYNPVFQFGIGRLTSVEDRANSTITFWIDRRELNGNGLIWRSTSGGTWTITPTDLLAKGFKESQTLSTTIPPVVLWEVLDVDGFFTCVRFNLYNSNNNTFNICIYNGSANAVTQLTIYNPTLLFTKLIDINHRYNSEAENNKSRWIGKRLLYLGDSQYNMGQMQVELARKFGFTIIDAHNGGHKMAMTFSSKGNLNGGSFYHTNLRDKVLAFTNIDIYLFTCSSNDVYGGGDSSDAAVNAVLANYPAYGDDATAITAKMSLFNALTQPQMDSIFAFKNTYSAYIYQVLQRKPNAIILTCSVPMSLFGRLTGTLDANGHGIWAAGQNPSVARAEENTGRQQIRKDIIEISDKYSATFTDLLNLIGLTYENYTNFCQDGVHWYPEIHERIGKAIAATIDRLG